MKNNLTVIDFQIFNDFYVEPILFTRLHMKNDLVNKQVTKQYHETYSLDVKLEVNGLGLDCPEPLMMLRKALRSVEPGDIVVLLSDDPVSLRDVPALCEFMNHILLESPTDNNNHRFVIRKGERH